MASQLVPLFHCPVCPSSSPFVAPVTLFCGHTVCARHVLLSPSSPSSPRLLRLSPCPLSSCTVSPLNTATLPNIPSSSRVAFYPAADVALDRDAAAFATIPQSRTDVTINKLANIVQRYDRLARSTRTLDSGSGTDDDDEEISDTNTARPSPSQPGATTPGSTSIVPSDASSSSISTQIASSLDASLQHQAPARSNARKRRRKHLPPPRRLDSPAQSTDQFENELLAELSCEICLNLLYQPITSPCQHVRALLSHPSSLFPCTPLLNPLYACQTLCSRCLYRSLDHGHQCPLCRQELPGVLYYQDHPFNKTIISISKFVRTPIHECQLTPFVPLPSPASHHSLSRGLRRTQALDRARRASYTP